MAAGTYVGGSGGSSTTFQPTDTVQWTGLTKLTAPADGTLQITKQDGSFGAALFGAAGATTGIRMTPSNGAVAWATGNAVGSVTQNSGQFVSTGNSTCNTANNTGAGYQFGSGAAAMFIGKRASVNSIYYVADGTVGTQGQAGFLLQGVYSLIKTASFTVPITDSGLHYNNAAAGALVTYTLPAAAFGLAYVFSNATASGIALDAAGTDIIQLPGLASSAGGVVTTTTVGGFVHIVCAVAGTWQAIALGGTWT